MPDHIRHNAYRILGLGSNASQRDIMKRYRDIINRLKIDDHPRYDSDLNMPDDFRTEDYVNDALKKLQNHKSGLTEYFFWFSVSDTVDEEAFERLRHGGVASYGQAAQIWNDHSMSAEFPKLSYRKNLAILYCLSLFSEENDAVLTKSVMIWNEIVNSNGFWAWFERKHAVDSGSELHEVAVNDLRKRIVGDISDIYYDLYDHHGDLKYVRAFQDAFGTFGQKTENHLLKPIHRSVYEAIESLNRISREDDGDSEEVDDANAECSNCGKVSERFKESHFDYKDGSILCQGCYETVGKTWQKRVDSLETVEGSSKKLRRVEKAMELLELNLNQLHGLGLYCADQSIAMRDHAADAIRNAAVMLHNRMHMRKKSLELLSRAKKISATAGARELLESNSRTIAENITRDEMNAFALEIGSNHERRLVVKETFMEYDESKVYYNDVDSLLHYESGYDYVFGVTSSRDSIFIKLNNRSYWIALLDRVLPLVMPHLVDNIVKRVFERGQPIRIGEIYFDKKGYHRQETFRVESVLWDETIHVPGIVAAEAILYKDKNDAPERFASVSLRELNATIIPPLVKACHREFHLRYQK